LPDLLTVVPIHIGPFTHEQVVSDTAMIAGRAYRYGRFAVLGGDFNVAPARENLIPQHGTGAKARDFQFRYQLNGDGDQTTIESDVSAARKMIQADYVDCADYLYDKTNNEALLAGTVGDSGRIDRLYVTYPMRNAVVEYRRLFDLSVSDHAGIVIVVDTDKIDTDYRFSIEEFERRKHLV
jgi:exonuclease III